MPDDIYVKPAGFAAVTNTPNTSYFIT